jgi:hypothetical protein
MYLEICNLTREGKEEVVVVMLLFNSSVQVKSRKWDIFTLTSLSRLFVVSSFWSKCPKSSKYLSSNRSHPKPKGWRGEPPGGKMISYPTKWWYDESTVNRPAIHLREGVRSWGKVILDRRVIRSGQKKILRLDPSHILYPERNCAVVIKWRVNL